MAVSANDLAVHDLSNLRKPYVSTPMIEEQLPTRNPFKLFDLWFTEAKSLLDNELTFEEVNAFALSTVDEDNFPQTRMVLMKEFNANGVVFFTNYKSDKACQINFNCNVSALFYWPILHKQIRVLGHAEKIAADESDAYWYKRPIESRLSALASCQSSPVPDRAFLLKTKENLQSKIVDGELPRPDHWGGYLIRPIRYEFWVGQTDRLHDRIVFESRPAKQPKSAKECDHTQYKMFRLAP